MCPLSDAELKKSSDLLLSPPNKLIADVRSISSRAHTGKLAVRALAHFALLRSFCYLVVQKYNIEITGKELVCLRNLNWLNDETINFYMEMLGDRERRNRAAASQGKVLASQRDRVHFFSSFFYTKMSEGGVYTYKNVSRWAKKAKIDVLTLDKIILPVHVGHNHWCCAIINIKQRQLEYYDSLGGTNRAVFTHLKQYVTDEIKANHPTKVQELKIDTWKELNVQGIPQQNNGSDCGVFTLKFADYASENRPFNFSYRLVILTRAPQGGEQAQRSADELLLMLLA